MDGTTASVFHHAILLSSMYNRQKTHVTASTWKGRFHASRKRQEKELERVWENSNNTDHVKLQVDLNLVYTIEITTLFSTNGSNYSGLFHNLNPQRNKH